MHGAGPQGLKFKIFKKWTKHPKGFTHPLISVPNFREIWAFMPSAECLEDFQSIYGPGPGPQHKFFNSNLLEIWPTERALDSLKPDVTKNIISQELKQISPSCKKQWKADLIMI